jgi:hypothetical protein
MGLTVPNRKANERGGFTPRVERGLIEYGFSGYGRPPRTHQGTHRSALEPVLSGIDVVLEG